MLDGTGAADKPMHGWPAPRGATDPHPRRQFHPAGRPASVFANLPRHEIRREKHRQARNPFGPPAHEGGKGSSVRMRRWCRFQARWIWSSERPFVSGTYFQTRATSNPQQPA